MPTTSAKPEINIQKTIDITKGTDGAKEKEEKSNVVKGETEDDKKKKDKKDKYKVKFWAIGKDY